MYKVVSGSSRPAEHGRAFACPACGLSAEPHWQQIDGLQRLGSDSLFETSRCRGCGHTMLWRTWFTTTLRYTGEVIYPTVTVPSAEPRLSADAARDYREARAIAEHSPRSAAALLRSVLAAVCAEVTPKEASGKVPAGTVGAALVEAKLVGPDALSAGLIADGDDALSVARLFAKVRELSAYASAA